MEKQEYRSSARSKRLIREAFLELLHEKSFDKISVTEIAKRADLNRSTFYAYYADVYALVEEVEDEIVQLDLQILSELKYPGIVKNPLPYLLRINRVLEDNRELYRYLAKSSYAQGGGGKV